MDAVSKGPDLLQASFDDALIRRARWRAPLFHPSEWESSGPPEPSAEEPGHEAVALHGRAKQAYAGYRGRELDMSW